MNTNNQLWERLAGYMAGNLSEKEQNEFSDWLREASPEDRKAFEAAKKLWLKSGGTNAAGYVPDIEKGWRRFQLKVAVRERTKRPFSLAKLAAVILVLMSFFVFLFLRNSNTSTSILIHANAEVEKVELPDGTSVWLNQGASLQYAEDFNEDNRLVSLNGEAFFEVKKSEVSRFTILTETTRTEVFGTSFNLKAVPGEPVKVQVATGKVAFTVLEGEVSVFLEPGQEAVYVEDEKIPLKKPIENENYRAWQTRELVFNNARLQDMAAELDDFFHVDIVVPEELENCRFTVSFNDPTLKEVLDILAITGDFTIIEEPNRYVFSGKACMD